MRAAATLIGLFLGAFYTFWQYKDAMAAQAWTAASISLGMGAVLTLGFAGLGLLFGSFLRNTAADRHEGRARLLAALGLAFAAYYAVDVYHGHLRRNYLRVIRQETLTLERARALLAGTREERSAMAYNQKCPPEILLQLSHDADESIRAGAGGNFNSPPEVLDALEKDPSESVRRYVEYNRSARKKWGQAKP